MYWAVTKAVIVASILGEDSGMCQLTKSNKLVKFMMCGFAPGIAARAVCDRIADSSADAARLLMSGMQEAIGGTGDIRRLRPAPQAPTASSPQDPVDDAKPEWRALSCRYHGGGNAKELGCQQPQPAARIILWEVIPQIVGIA